MFNAKCFILICDWYLNFKIFNIFFKCLTFLKYQPFGELFQKRFATGICDLGGYPPAKVIFQILKF